jgi:hypothetical protein
MVALASISLVLLDSWARREIAALESLRAEIDEN